MVERTFIIIVLFLTTLVTLILAVLCWRRRSSGISALLLTICMVTVSIYSFGYAMEIGSEELETAMFWVRFEHWGIDFIAPAWLLFSLSVSGYEKRITKKLIIALFIFPIILFLFSQTLGWLNLAHHNPRMDTSGSFPAFAYDRSFYNFAVIGYSGLCLSISFILFLVMLIKSAAPFRKQAAVYLVGSLPPWIGSVVFTLNVFSSNIDYTPLGLGISAIIFAIGFFKYRILDIIPMARDTIIENMKDGVLILDLENRIIDFNPTLRAIFPQISNQEIGIPFQKVISGYPALIKLIQENRTDRIEIEINEGENPSFYRVSLAMIVNRKGKLIGKIISFYEFTSEKCLLEKLERLATTDRLTGIFNRQHFDVLIRKEMSRINRYGGDLSLIMFDLDHFKAINDTYGHIAGDTTLISVVDTLRGILRETDIMARFGGEEFLILTPHTSVSEAKVLAERLCHVLSETQIHVDGTCLSVRASFGIAGVNSDEDITLENLYHLVDQATYQAKACGGNTVCIGQA